MKFFFAILTLICFILVHKSLAKPAYVTPNLIRSMNPRLGLSNVNCVFQCVQPIGNESEEDTIQVRGIISNYGTLFDCMKKCNDFFPKT
jgi:hypothetical protein